MLVKVHKNQDKGMVLAICDDNLIDKKFEEGDLQLDLSGSFYKGAKFDEESIRKMIKEAYIINVVGEKSINFCIKEKIMDKNCVLRIKNIPHAQTIFSE